MPRYMPSNLHSFTPNSQNPSIKPQNKPSQQTSSMPCYFYHQPLQTKTGNNPSYRGPFYFHVTNFFRCPQISQGTTLTGNYLQGHVICSPHYLQLSKILRHPNIHVLQQATYLIQHHQSSQVITHHQTSQVITLSCNLPNLQITGAPSLSQIVQVFLLYRVLTSNIINRRINCLKLSQTNRHPCNFPLPNLLKC